MMDNDPWLIQSSKGRARPSPVTLGDFTTQLPGLSQIEPKVAPPPPVPAQPLSREELVRGMDLIQDLLDKQTDEETKRAEASQLAALASVPWRRKRHTKVRFLDGPASDSDSEAPPQIGTHNTCRDSCCGDFRGPSGGM